MAGHLARAALALADRQPGALHLRPDLGRPLVPELRWAGAPVNVLWTVMESSETRIRFRVMGEPATEGSHRAFLPRGALARMFRGEKVRPIVKHDATGLAGWRRRVAMGGLAAMRGRAPWQGPVALGLSFYFAWPRSYRRADGVPKASAPPYPTAKDLDKQIRAVGDALNKITWIDDRHVVIIEARKEWGEVSGVVITVTSLAAHPAPSSSPASRSSRTGPRAR